MSVEGEIKMLIQDRNLESTAKSLIETFLPEANVRKLCLEALAESIILAHQENSSRWGITLFPNLVRLNVGMIETFVISPNKLYMIADFSTLNLDIADIKGVEIYASTPDLYVGVYKSVPGSTGCEFPANLFSKVKPYLWDSHRQLVINAATTRRHPTTQDAHSPGILIYLRNELGIQMPDPIYPLEDDKRKPKSGRNRFKVDPNIKAAVDDIEKRDQELRKDD